MSEAKEKDPVAEFFVTRTAELPNKQGMQVVMTLYKEESQADQYKKLGRLNALIDRARDEYELPMIEDSLEAKEKALVQHMEVIEGIAVKKRGEGKGRNNSVTTQEETLFANSAKQLAQGREIIEAGRRRVNEIRESLGLELRKFS